MHRKNRTFSGQNDSLTASNSVKNLESTLRINSDLHVDPAENVGNRYLEVSPQRQKWYARRSGRNNTRTVILPASRCFCAALFSKEMGTTLLSIEFSTHTEILASPATASCSVAHRYRASYPSFVHWLSSTRTSEPFRLPAGYLAEAGSGRLKSQHKYRKGRFFDTNHETSPETSVTITLSHVVMYTPCGAAMVPWPQVCCWS